MTDSRVFSSRPTAKKIPLEEALNQINGEFLEKYNQGTTPETISLLDVREKLILAFLFIQGRIYTDYSQNSKQHQMALIHISFYLLQRLYISIHWLAIQSSEDDRYKEPLLSLLDYMPTSLCGESKLENAVATFLKDHCHAKLNLSINLPEEFLRNIIFNDDYSSENSPNLAKIFSSPADVTLDQMVHDYSEYNTQHSTSTEQKNSEIFSTSTSSTLTTSTPSRRSWFLNVFSFLQPKEQAASQKSLTTPLLSQNPET